MGRPTTIGAAISGGGPSLAYLSGGTTIPGNGSSGVIPIDYRTGGFQTTVACIVSSGASLTYSLQYTADDLMSMDYLITGRTSPSALGYAALPETALQWFNHPSFTAQTASGISNIAFPITAVRLILTAWTSGGVWARVIQTPNVAGG